MKNKGFSRNFWVLLVMAIILGIIFWSVGGSRIYDEVPFYFKKIIGETATVTINNYSYDVEIAKTEAARVKGLSKRNYLENGHGMLFVFEEADYYNFTLKDTKISLDIIWIMENTIVDMKPSVAPGTGLLTPLNKANYVLEIRPNNISTRGFKIGDQVNITFDR